MTKLSTDMRFDRLVTKRTGGCWIYGLGKSYGNMHIDGRQVRAHRYSYERFVGPIPAGLTIDHLCRVPACVNPEHLEPVTLAENNRRALPFRRNAEYERGGTRKVTTVRLPPLVWRKLERLAKRTDRSAASHIRQAVREYIDRQDGRVA